MKANVLFRSTIILSFFLLFVSNMQAQTYVDNVGLCGPAAINGWSQYGPVQMIQNNASPNIYTFEGYLSTGELKFSTNAGWTPCWGPTVSGTAMPSTGYSGAVVAVDNKFVIQTAGNYSITLDLAALTVNFQPMTETTPIMVNRLFIVGDGAAGWDLAKAPELTRTTGNPWEFTYQGTLTSTGSFKFGTSKGDWSQKFYVKTSDVLMNLGGADVKWSVPSTGPYKIVLNTNTLAISITSNVTTVNEAITNIYPHLNSSVVRDVLQVSTIKEFGYSITAVTGRACLKGYSLDGIIDISSLSAGVYVLTIDNKSFKFIKL